MKRMILTCLTSCTCLTAWLCLFFCYDDMAQSGGGVRLAMAGSGTVLVMPGVNLPLDSMTRDGLIRSLQGWLRLEADPADSFTVDEDRVATRLLLEELWNMEKKIEGKDTGFYQCYLTNAIKQDSGKMLVQFAYIGINGQTPFLRASYNVVARRSGNRWFFSSPLAQNTITWKSRQVGNCVFHFKTELNVDKAREYEQKIAFYDQKVKAPASTLDFYCCDDLVEASQLIGLEYKSDYSGLAHDEYSTSVAAHSVIVNGNVTTDHFNQWDPHDTWHFRLHRVLSPSIINRPVDEGSAYLFGGSWQIYSWADILALMKAYASEHPDADWLALYKDAANLVPPPKTVKISYTINALIVQQLDKEGRWPAVVELMCCGQKQPGDSNYFAALKKVTGVDENGFNSYVNGLVKAPQ
jgi:hypothetical protein